MKKLAAAAAVLLLAGCASAPRPQVNILHHSAPIIKATPIAQSAPVTKPPTFKERFKKFSGRLKWVH